ncbi:RHS repeat domain-containing protein [Roseateles depolymerans]|uniref:Teneurin-like YD-shell domain-containing protein n=1 Tax=Roseateles depolymerans TaxID=76731 RepID=A0A0U3N5A6_9BURK|nr:RHS repeat-associated core domain-containing protein [Roseateles depolymerans]ALV07387.1 hypothetical protein RD2015_2925 [Roseateles depolymerans]REG22401.1 RHS repeat-associated protein [Roseateles depolymerans]
MLEPYASIGEATAATQALEQTFGYDELGRLTTISTPAQSWTIGYDANGNRTQVTLNGTSRAYTTSATSNRLEQISNPVRSMSYDAAGNTLTDTAMYSSAVYSTDNRLTAITKAGQTTSYSYDAGGQRVSKSNAAAPAQARLFVYGSSPELLEEYAQDGSAIQEVVWLDGQPLIVLGKANSNEVFFSYSDHLGAPRILVDRSGAEHWRWIAEPFGSTAAEPAPSGLAAVAFPLRFPGQYFDGETGLNYNYFRDYDSTSGRYVQSDPIGSEGGINPYSYVGGNPFSYIDPTGEVGIPGAIYGGIAGGIGGYISGGWKGAIYGAGAGALVGAVNPWASHWAGGAAGAAAASLLGQGAGNYATGKSLSDREPICE